MSTLIVALPPDPAGPETEFAFALTPDGQAVADHGAAAAALLPGAAQVVALVPVDALSWHRVELPKGALACIGTDERTSGTLKYLITPRSLGL